VIEAGFCSQLRLHLRAVIARDERFRAAAGAKRRRKGRHQHQHQ
jgi:hypothetical protein